MTSFIAIEDLLGASRDNDWPVLINNGSVSNWLDWLSRVATWRQLLEQRDEQDWALYHDDAGEFSAILFALWSLGKTAYLPGSRQPALVAGLAKQVDAFIGDFDGLVPTPAPTAPLPQALNQQLLSELAQIKLDPNAVLLKVYTSGSSGEPQAIPKTIKQLSREVAHLQALWGNDLCSALPSSTALPASPTLVLATVSHQHIYGLLFRVLWPLAAGHCFDTQACEYLEEIKSRARLDWPLALISSPTHLSRIPAQLDGETLKKLSAIFSSGAPLQRETSLLARERFGVDISEVYGSSETGGIAWRQQSPGDEAFWQAMPGVQVRKNKSDDTLEVCSDHLPDTVKWLQTADRVRFNNDSEFALLGRADRIVKVEGKRTSLDEMETCLLEHPFVKASRLLMIEGQRVEIAAVVVLSTAAEKLMSDKGKRRLNELLREHLLQSFERPLLPRRWRYVEQLPINSQGKLEQKTLLDLFAKTAEQARPQLPVELERHSLSAEHLRLQLQVPEDLLFFGGHFDEAPILPGVVQVHWANHYARQMFTLDQDFLRLEVIKFKQIIHPGQKITLELQYDSAKQKIDFTYYSDLGPHASGRIVLGQNT
ncbi:MAG: AMP-binding protein [Porticoccaceae bacterium]|nr:AMP-binding protein [Porticoccaceae bacterium]